MTKIAKKHEYVSTQVVWIRVRVIAIMKTQLATWSTARPTAPASLASLETHMLVVEKV